MEERVRKCDFPVGRGQCKQRVTGDVPSRFCLADVEYHADLCDKHYRALEDALAPFVNIAQPSTTRVGKAVRRAMRGKRGDTFTTKDVREWLIAQGREVAPTGKISDRLMREFDEAHS